ncbi:LADA_0F14378g1_1 [Lachancea dasiensis]|uniref:peptidylprolyl isomerase n=1 Tax=Lachancea dasiensis TaxID=1072105 RepID=A0A1G4JND2_9SACH|nr:LADA_0F14378g1_1 [Lachancea dasiensis]
MLFRYLVCILCTLFEVGKAAQIDSSKIYEPNPPVTHRAFFTIEYTDRTTSQVKELDLTIELYGTVVPKTVENFAKLTKGVTAVIRGTDEENDRFQLGYKDTKFHRIVPDFIIQGGDVLPDVGPFNIFGKQYFEDENFQLKHDRPGRLSMANLDKPDSNASQFFIVTSLEPQTHLDAKHVVFGQVVSGLDELIKEVQYVEVDEQHKPLADVKLIYTLVEELQISGAEDLHKQWLDQAEKFQHGDMSQGVSMATTLATGKKEEAIMKEVLFEQLHHPAVKVASGMVLLLVIYLIVRKTRIFSKNTKIVSMRHD